MIRTFFLCLALATPALAGQAPQADGVRPAVHAARITPGESITVDGQLDEPAWQSAEPAAGFIQSEPQNGQPESERSEIRIVFDRDSLYIAARFYDSSPEGLLANQMVRDGNLNADDRFMWVLDPFDDHLSGYFFEVNPAGAMGDAQLIGATGGANFGMAQNRAWDGIWRARVRRHSEGWSAEIQIPFRTLNFDPDGGAWGANFQRTVRRKNEEDFWTGWGRNQGLLNLATSGRIEGISDVSQGHGLDIKPYVTGTYREDPSRGVDSTYKGNEGIDFFYSVTPQLKANLTINTDFAQTEVDDRQVNLTRFPLFFPEKRDFFLESAGNFDFARETPANITAFFSRRVGLDANTGRPQKIDYGAKLAGRASDFDLGLMHVRTAEERGVSGEDFTVFRPKFRFLNQSNAGVIYTRRSTRNSGIPDRHTIGADFQVATSRFLGRGNLSVSGFYMKTPDGMHHGDDAAWGYRVDYPNDLWGFRYAYKSFQKNVNPAVGFVEQVNYHKWTPGIRFGPRPRNSRWVRQVVFEIRAELYDDSHGQWTQREIFLTPLRLELQSGDTLNVQITPTYDHLEENFRIAQGISLPRGSDYKFTRYGFGFTSANRRKISLSSNLTGGAFFSGHRRDFSTSLNIRPRRGVLATLTGTFNRVELAEGNFSTRILRAVINTQFSPFISVANNIQYDSVSRVVGWQSRFRWIMAPGSDMYVVWLNNWLDAGGHFNTLDRSAAVKLTYTYRF